MPRPTFPALVLAAVVFPLATALAGVTITVLDVGQGDATLVRSTSGGTLLFDGGPNGRGADTILPYLAAQGIASLDYIVASHYHSDHLGGLDEVYDRTGATGGVWDRGWTYTTSTYRTYAATVADDRQTLTDGQVFDLGDGVTVTCIAVNGNGELAAPHDDSDLENECSVALIVRSGDFDYFQAGDLIGIDDGGHVDIETSVAQELTALGEDDIEVYKVNHHGSYTSSNAALLNALSPEVAVISVSATNSYGHPHEEPLLRLLDRDIFVYQTTAGNGYVLPPSHLSVVNGHVVIETSGHATYTVDGDSWTMDDVPTAAPSAFAGVVLQGNEPNPFNPSTTIRFRSDAGGPGSLEVFDAAGRLVSSRSFRADPGLTMLPWSGARLASGVYLYRITLQDGSASGRMVLTK